MQRLCWQAARNRWRHCVGRLLLASMALTGGTASAQADFQVTTAGQLQCPLATADLLLPARWPLADLIDQLPAGDELPDSQTTPTAPTSWTNQPIVHAVEMTPQGGKTSNDACPPMAGVSLDLVLDLVQTLAEQTVELTQDWFRQLTVRTEQDQPQETSPLAPQAAQLAGNVGAFPAASEATSPGDDVSTEPAAWCGAILTAPSGDRVTESRVEESNCTWAGCGGLGPLQWPSPDGGWGIGAFAASHRRQMQQAAEHLTPAASQSIASLLFAGDHAAGRREALAINAEQDGLTRRQWEQLGQRFLTGWKVPQLHLPEFQATDFAAVRSLYFWWQSAQSDLAANELGNDVARIDSSPASAVASPNAAAPLAPFEPIIDGPGRYLYLRGEWSPPASVEPLPQRSALAAVESAPACGADATVAFAVDPKLAWDEERRCDPLEQWVGCDAYPRFASRCRGIELDRAEWQRAAEWCGRACATLAPVAQWSNQASSRVGRLTVELPRAVVVGLDQLAALQRAADALASASGQPRPTKPANSQPADAPTARTGQNGAPGL